MMTWRRRRIAAKIINLLVVALYIGNLTLFTLTVWLSLFISTHIVRLVRLIVLESSIPVCLVSNVVFVESLTQNSICCHQQGIY